MREIDYQFYRKSNSICMSEWCVMCAVVRSDLCSGVRCWSTVTCKMKEGNCFLPVLLVGK